jgi:hypothetical protein
MPLIVVSCDGASGGSCTVTVVVALTVPDDAVIREVPAATALTRPVLLTVATDCVALDQVNAVLAIALPRESCAVAFSCTVPPMVSGPVGGAIVIVAMACWTATAVEPVSVPPTSVAVTVALPFATAVTTPEDETVATFAFEVDQVNDLPATASPLEFFATAVA